MGGYNRGSLICLIVSAVFVHECCQATGVNFCGSPQELPCDNSECISREVWCDREIIDCVDGSDEQYCEEKGWFGPVPDNHCTEKHFTCVNGPCIPAVARCDKNYDCSDWSDEEDCEETTTAANLGNSVPQIVETSQDNTTSSSYDNNDENTQDKLLPRSPSMTVSSTTTTTSTTTVRPTTQRSITSTVSSRFPSSTGFYVKRSDEAYVQINVQRRDSQNRNDQYSPNYNGLPSNNYNRGYDTSHTTDNYYGQNKNGRVGYNFQKPHSSYPSGKNAVKHKKELQELIMQHKIKEHELSMQSKREEFELIMQHKREELELIIQHKREQLELTMQHKRELDHITQLRREE